MTEIEKIYKEYKESFLEREISIDKLKADIGDMLYNIVLYGAGSAGIAFFHYLSDADIHPRYFSDGDAKKWGSYCEGLEVISPEKICEIAGENVLVITTINTDGKNYCKSFDEALRKGGPAAVNKRLAQAGCKNIIDYSYFRRCFSLFKKESYNLPSCSDVFLMEDKMGLLERICSWLEDDISRETFEKIIKFRMVDDSIEIPTFEQKDEYFAYDVYSRIDSEIFIDGGAYTGTTLEIFLANNRNCFQKYYAFEPDKENYDKLIANIDSRSNEIKKKIIPYNAALYDSTGKVLPLVDLHSPGSFINMIGKAKASTMCIDDMKWHERITFIKMNIEGCEIPALKGCERTIKRDKPVLAIMGYHKTWDLWEIPMLIKQLNLGYHLYLRSHMNHMSFMFYAVPEWRCVK